MWQRKALSGTLTDSSWTYPPDFVGKTACPGQCPGYQLKWMDYAFDGVPGKLGKTDSSYSTNLRNDAFLLHLTPSTQLYAESIPYVYNKFTWDGCAIGKAYRGTVDTSLMDKDAWISASELGWLNELK